jgi:hypothetical protein
VFRMHSAGQEVALEDWWKRAGAEGRSGCIGGRGREQQEGAGAWLGGLAAVGRN